MPAPAQFPADQSAFFARIDRRFRKIEFSAIRYVEACRNYSKVHTADKSYLILLPIKEMEALLPKKEFCRIHRSFIVSIACLQSFDHQQAYFDDCQFPIGEHYFPLLQQRLIIVNGGRNSQEFTRGLPDRYTGAAGQKKPA